MKTKNLVLTGGDVEVFRWLWMLRVMTLEQIRRVRYYQPETGTLSALDNVRKRLKRLWDAGYLIGDRLTDTKERLYTLDQKAIAPLREHYGIDQRRVYKPRSADSLLQLKHPLLVSECAVRIVESIRSSNIESLDLAPLWVPFVHTHAIRDSTKKKHVERFVSQEDIRVAGHPLPFRIRPDLVFALAQGDIARLYFLEADRGSESPQDIQKKQIGYHYYLTAPDPREPSRFLWQQYGDVRDFRVLFVTTNGRRITALRRTLGTHPGFALLAFTSIDNLKSRNTATDRIWTIPDGRKMALVKKSAQPKDIPKGADHV